MVYTNIPLIDPTLAPLVREVRYEDLKKSKAQ